MREIHVGQRFYKSYPVGITATAGAAAEILLG